MPRILPVGIVIPPRDSRLSESTLVRRLGCGDVMSCGPDPEGTPHPLVFRDIPEGWVGCVSTAANAPCGCRHESGAASSSDSVGATRTSAAIAAGNPLAAPCGIHSGSIAG